MEIGKTIYFDGNDHINEVAIELDALCAEYKRNAVLVLQSKVQRWAILYSKLPCVCRPFCLRQFRKYAQRYNAVVCSLFPAYAGTPTPIEEFVNIEI